MISEEDKAREARIEFYGKDDARAFDSDEIWIMNNYAQSRESLLKEEVERLKKENEFVYDVSANQYNKIQELEQKNKELREALQECIDMIHTLEYYNDELDQKVEELLKQ